MLKKQIEIISGGQTGVDRGALNAALQQGVACGGFCPRGRVAEDGVIPAEYPLIETISSNYIERTRLNVEKADITIIITYDRELTGGSKSTYEHALKCGNPCRVMCFPCSASELLQWISERSAEKVNVAGPRESEARGIQLSTERLFCDLFDLMSG